MKNFESNYSKLLEGLNSIKFVKRVFYPRNFSISDEFKNAFTKEFKRLQSEGHSPNHILNKLSKALIFLARKS